MSSHRVRIGIPFKNAAGLAVLGEIPLVGERALLPGRGDGHFFGERTKGLLLAIMDNNPGHHTDVLVTAHRDISSPVESGGSRSFRHRPDLLHQAQEVSLDPHFNHLAVADITGNV